jgi:hypothetical protein
MGAAMGAGSTVSTEGSGPRESLPTPARSTVGFGLEGARPRRTVAATPRGRSGCSDRETWVPRSCPRCGRRTPVVWSGAGLGVSDLGARAVTTPTSGARRLRQTLTGPTHFRTRSPRGRRWCLPQQHAQLSVSSSPGRPGSGCSRTTRPAGPFTRRNLLAARVECAQTLPVWRRGPVPSGADRTAETTL